jgi:hypothetical protein
MKQSVVQPKDFPKNTYLGFLLKLSSLSHFGENLTKITIQFARRLAYVCDLSLGLFFVTEKVFYVRYVLGTKKVSIKEKDCVHCEVRTETKETVKHHA